MNTIEFEEKIGKLARILECETDTIRYRIEELNESKDKLYSIKVPYSAVEPKSDEEAERLLDCGKMEIELHRGKYHEFRVERMNNFEEVSTLMFCVSYHNNNKNN